LPRQSFTLVRYPAPGPHRNLMLGGTAGRDGDDLVVRWSLRGDVDAIAVPAPAAGPARRDALWTDTCFEVFAARLGDPGYWELNLAPSGDWNVYRFAGYRQQMRPEAAAAALGCAVAQNSRALTVQLRCPLAGFAVDGALELGVGVVLRSPTGALSHWALAHAPGRPDFHWRPGFKLRI